MTVERSYARESSRGALWVGALRVTQQLVTLLQITILGRLLEPRDFGLMGIVLISIRFAEVFTYTGFEYALIHRQDADERTLHTTWWTLFLRRVLIAVALGVLAVPVSRLYREPAVIWPLLVMASDQIVRGATSLGVVLLQKELRFRRYVVVQAGGLVVGFVAAVGAALMLRSVWALVVAWMARSLATAVLSYGVHPYRPRLVFSRASARDLTGFGRWIQGSAILYFVVMQGADAISGLVFGAAALGSYQMASRFALLPTTQVGDVVLGTVLPSYARLQHDLPRLRAGFFRVLRVVLLLVVPLTILVATLLPDVLLIALGRRWSQSASLVPIIAVSGFLQALTRTGSPLFLATGRPKLQFAMDLVSAGVMMALIVPAGRLLQVPGLALASAAGLLVATIAWLDFVARCVAVPRRVVVRQMVPLALAAIPTAGGLLLLHGGLGWVACPLLRLVLCGVFAGIGAIIFVMALAVASRLSGVENPTGDLLRVLAARSPGWLERRLAPWLRGSIPAEAAGERSASASDGRD